MPVFRSAILVAIDLVPAVVLAANEQQRRVGRRRVVAA
ncbi:hypothetical protein Lsed01_01646 [Demequina sediminis]|uniref:Uncharacterized protein n=1 Tax=Demequina sediminis TaxID=1930058 RepID=A0ABP9WJS9_9MICO